MSGDRIRSVLRGVDFEPVKVEAVRCQRDRYGRQLFRPVVDGRLGGSVCRIMPLDLGCYSSTKDAIADGEKWAELL